MRTNSRIQEVQAVEVCSRDPTAASVGVRRLLSGSDEGEYLPYRLAFVDDARIGPGVIFLKKQKEKHHHLHHYHHHHHHHHHAAL